MSTATIRPASRDDVRHLSVLLAPEPLFSSYGLTAEALDARWGAAVEAGDRVLVAEVAGGPVGLCWFAASGTFGTGAYLRLIAVARSAQGQAVGAALLAAYEAACGTPAGGWFLLTSDFNTGAQRFYSRHGYREVGQLPDFAKAGITERIFWKPPAR
jgi:ribosomal protein S18 acetylase RimI-like enzyme